MPTLFVIRITDAVYDMEAPTPLFPLFCLMSILLSPHTYGEEHYQFSIATLYEKEKIDYAFGSGDGASYALGAAAYFEPVILDGSLPYDAVPFHTKKSTVFVTAANTKYDDFRLALAGEVITKVENKAQSFGLHLAQTEIPVWLGADFTRVGEQELSFASGATAKAEKYNIVEINLGWHLVEWANPYVFYEKADDDKTIGLGMRSLWRLGHAGFLTSDLALSKTDFKVASLEVVNNTLRSTTTSTEESKTAILELAYYPIVELGIGLSYQRYKPDVGTTDKTRSVGISYYFTTNVNANLEYDHRDFNVFGDEDSDALRLGLSFQF